MKETEVLFEGRQHAVKYLLVLTLFTSGFGNIRNLILTTLRGYSHHHLRYEILRIQIYSPISTD
jgi:hypothetical protein